MQWHRVLVKRRQFPKARNERPDFGEQLSHAVTERFTAVRKVSACQAVRTRSLVTSSALLSLTGKLARASVGLEGAL